MSCDNPIRSPGARKSRLNLLANLAMGGIAADHAPGQPLLGHTLADRSIAISLGEKLQGELP